MLKKEVGDATGCENVIAMRIANKGAALRGDARQISSDANSLVSDANAIHINSASPASCPSRIVFIETLVVIFEREVIHAGMIRVSRIILKRLDTQPRIIRRKNGKCSRRFSVRRMQASHTSGHSGRSQVTYAVSLRAEAHTHFILKG